MRFIIRTVMLIALGMDRIITQRIWRFDWKQRECRGIRFAMYLSDRQRHQHGTIPAH